jgi:hypothetical protein
VIERDVFNIAAISCKELFLLLPCFHTLVPALLSSSRLSLFLEMNTRKAFHIMRIIARSLMLISSIRLQ